MNLAPDTKFDPLVKGWCSQAIAAYLKRYSELSTAIRTDARTAASTTLLAVRYAWHPPVPATSETLAALNSRS